MERAWVVCYEMDWKLADCLIGKGRWRIIGKRSTLIYALSTLRLSIFRLIYRWVWCNFAPAGGCALLVDSQSSLAGNEAVVLAGPSFGKNDHVHNAIITHTASADYPKRGFTYKAALLPSSNTFTLHPPFL